MCLKEGKLNLLSLEFWTAYGEQRRGGQFHYTMSSFYLNWRIMKITLFGILAHLLHILTRTQKTEDC